MDVKINLALCGMYEPIVHSAERTVQLLQPHKYNVLYIIRNHIHPDLKSECVMEEESSTLWTTLQTHYE
jgi:xanthine dehydrogenase iron-sulfur cluster and FAD-binding subunit A